MKLVAAEKKAQFSPSIICVAGPTAIGKSALGVKLAQELNGEVINADSQQVYRGLDIGTGKPSPEEMGGVPHHLFDSIEPWEQLDAAAYAELADEAIADIASRGRVPILVGGTGLWLRSVYRGIVPAPPRNEEIRRRLEEEGSRLGWPELHRRLQAVDPVGAEKIRPNDPIRIVRSLEVWEQGGVPFSELQRQHSMGSPRYRSLFLALALPRAQLNERIAKRARLMFEQGLIEQTRQLAADSRHHDRLRRVMGYREAMRVLDGELSEDEAIELTEIAQRQYAKRQLTWFRGETQWQWLEPDQDARALELARRFLAGEL